MDTDNDSEIVTPRLLLRKLKVEDWEMISFLRTDIDVNKYVDRPSAETREKALAFILKINGGIDDGNTYYWAIAAHKNNEMIGSICLWNIAADQKTAEVGYDLSPNFQGKGIMNEALSSILDFGFHRLNLENIEAYTHRDNENSKRLLERNGFRLELGKKDVDNENNIVYLLKKEGHTEDQLSQK